MERRIQRPCPLFSNFPFPVGQQAFCKLLICLLLIALSLHTTAGMAAKSPYDTIEGAASYIIENQNNDGGWPLIPGEESDAEITAIAMQALMLKGWGSGSSVIRRGVSYLIKHQKSDGSWNGNAAHTIFAAIALKRAEAVEYWEAQFNALKWLEETQKESGSWGREIRQPGNPLYTGAVLAGFLDSLTLTGSLNLLLKLPIGLLGASISMAGGQWNRGYALGLVFWSPRGYYRDYRLLIILMSSLLG